MSKFTDRIQEDRRHSAARAIAIVCEKLPNNHPVVRLIAQGKNDEALQILEGMDSIREWEYSQFNHPKPR
jgi:hypothetical protein